MNDARHLAQFNIARIRYPLDDPRMAEFVENVDRVNKLAEQIDGFVWRLHDASGHAMNMPVYDDPRILPNSGLAKCRGAGALRLADAASALLWPPREWFEPIETPLVLWWIPDGHRPDLAEGVARLDHLKAHGPSDHAFGWEGIPAAHLWKTARCVTE